MAKGFCGRIASIEILFFMGHTCMKAIIVEHIGDFTIADLPTPKPEKGEVLLRVETTGLCRTDLKIIEAGHRDLVLPRVPGEEVVGTICEIGSDVAGLNADQMFYVYPGTSCNKCPPCLAGAGNLCKNMQIMGFHRDGGFGEYVLAPVESLIAVPEGLAADEAVFAEPLSCCLNALELGNIRQGESIGIWGGGPAGVLLSRAAHAKGVEPTIVETHSNRRMFSNAIPAMPTGLLFDVCIVAVGDHNAYAQALEHLKPRGRLVVFSGLSAEKRKLSIDFNKLHYHEQTIVGAYGCSYRHGQEALSMLAGKCIQVKDMISHRLSLWDLQEALQLLQEKISMKILLYP